MEVFFISKIILDKYQRKIIKNKSKNLLIIAGAGSGKTLTIVYKIKNLIEKGIDPQKILCITFTKTAAKSLQQKLLKENISLEVKTFHSLGYQIITQTEKVKLVKDDMLDTIIIKHLYNTAKLYKIINAPFMEFGQGNSTKLKNNILKNSNYILYLKDTIKAFLNLFKSNNYNLSSFKKFLNYNKKKHFIKKQIRHKLFLNLVKNIYLEYEDYLESTKQIDFHDMINKSSNIVKKEGIYPYKYIIIDEYQDTSLNKCLLIKNIQDKTNASLIAVGDDWQSIYQFTGSNLEIFTNIKKYFVHCKILKLKNTYRICNELVKITKDFILKNPYQIKKTIKSNTHIKKPVHIYYYENNIKEIWNIIVSQIAEKTFVLGRNNKDREMIPYLNKYMTYMTIHKSKGLEADKIIIINLENTIHSLPSKIQNSEYLKYVISKADEFSFGEERRLFYVALTRTKSDVILLVKKNNPSIFVQEILQNSSKYIQIH